MKWIMEGGFSVMLQLIVTAGVLILIVRQLMLFSKNDSGATVKIKNYNDLIIYAGVLNLVIGLIGQLMGLFNALGAIIVATEISPVIVADGFRQASIPTIYGFWFLIIVSAFWIAFRVKVRTYSHSL